MNEGVPYSSPKRGADLITKFAHVLHQAIEHRSDVIHLHMPPPWALPVLYALRRPVVCHLHVRALGLGQLSQFSYSALFKLRPELIAVSEWVARDWIAAHKLNRDHLRVVYSGVPAHFDLPRGSPIGRSPRFGLAARIVPNKGFDALIGLGRAIVALDPGCTISVAGEGPDRVRLQAAVAQAGLAEKIQFCGFVSDMSGFWSSLDCAFSLSSEESFGLSMLEPVVHGIPSLAFRNGTGSDEVASKCGGIVLVKQGNISEFAATALSIARDYQLRARIVERGQRHIAAHFDVGKMERQVKEQYARLISGTPVHLASEGVSKDLG